MATDDVPHPEGLFASRLGSDTTAIPALIPRFATTVHDMIRRGLIEIREPPDTVWDKTPPLTAAEINAVLADPRTWIWSADGDNRMVMTMTTGHADARGGCQD